MESVPDAIGQYRILEFLGPNGLGDAYRARDTRLGRTVEVTLLPQNAVGTVEQRKRFLEDARLAATLSHPNIAAVYEAGVHDGRLYVAHEYVQGQTLTALVGGRPLNPRRAIDLAAQIADAVAEAHAANVPHGAIGPDAVVVTAKGSAKILSCGYARWIAGSRAQRLGDSDAYRDDIASVGTVLFEMLTGASPAPGARLPDVIIRAIPSEIDPIAAKAIGENERYESAAVLAADLRAVGAVLDSRKRATTPAPVGAFAGRSGPRAAQVVGVLLLIIGVLAAVWWYLRIG